MGKFLSVLKILKAVFFGGCDHERHRLTNGEVNARQIPYQLNPKALRWRQLQSDFGRLISARPS
jgi:hypothetical protein